MNAMKSIGTCPRCGDTLFQTPRADTVQCLRCGLNPQPVKLKFCNCAKCGAECLGDSFRDTYYRDWSMEQRSLHPEPVAGRVDGRPYCVECFPVVALRKRLMEV
jgi:ribosomal protein L37E